MVVDISLAGAGLLTEEPLVPGERVSLAFATPTLWDPLVVMAVVAWARPLVPGTDRRIAPQGTRSRLTSRAGVAFDHAEPPAVLALFEMLSTLVYE